MIIVLKNVDAHVLGLDQKFPPWKLSAGQGSLLKIVRKHAIRIHAALESHPWLSKVYERFLAKSPGYQDPRDGQELLGLDVFAFRAIF